jgi:PmbA protein
MTASAYDLERLKSLAASVVERAQKAGADVAECSVSEGRHLSAKVRLGEPELLEEAGSKSVGLRVMRGQQVAVTSTSDLTPDGIEHLVHDLDLFDDSVDSIDGARALDMAKRAESVALRADKRLTNSEGSTVSRQSGASALCTSGGFCAAMRGTYVSIVVNPVADDADGKKRSGYYWSARRHLDELESPEAVGEEAARRTLAKLGSRKLETQEVAVVFEPAAARSIIGLLASCITGGAAWRKSSYLTEREGDRIASDLVTLVDDPLIPRAPGSRPFDGEGLLSRRNVVVGAGKLERFLLDSYSARKLKKQSTASASRGGGGGVGASTSNFFLQPGTQTPKQLLDATERALYVTDMMGFGFNAVTGDFSRGAAGFWLERGERVFPVSEVTISLNLDDMLKRIDAVADDLDHNTSICAPTFRVSAMTLAGK